MPRGLLFLLISLSCGYRPASERLAMLIQKSQSPLAKKGRNKKREKEKEEALRDSKRFKNIRPGSCCLLKAVRTFT